MKHFLCGLLVLALLSPVAVRAEAQSEVIFAHKAWEVRVVGFEDGTISCLAQMTDGARSFTLWADAEATVQLQFYDESWDLGEGGTANLVVTVDSRSPWNLSNADLARQSVFFTLPAGDDGLNFIKEVMRGRTLYLNAEDGDSVENYSLAGSSASIGALIDCIDALKSDTNPFN